jgi:hypothetical protein
MHKAIDARRFHWVFAANIRYQVVSVPKPSIRARDRVVLALAARLFSSALNAVTGVGWTVD